MRDVHHPNIAHPSHQHAYARKQRGQLGGIVSTVLALAVAATGLAYVMGLFNSAEKSINSQGAATDFIAMIGNTQKTYSHSPSGYIGIAINDMGHNGDIPASMWNSATPTVMKSPFGTTVAVASSTVNVAGDSATFTLKVPQDNCADFARAMVGSVEALQVGDSVIVDNNTGTALTPSTLGDACAGTAGAKQFVLTITR